MIDELAKRSHALFKQAIEIDESRRGQFIEAACANDAALRKRVLALVGALNESQTFLETPALTSAPPAPAPPGLVIDRINGFEIVGVIGSGGMATVYEAMQDKPRRRVALKVMKHGLSRTAALRRFEFETEVLARLQHPGIARIYEVGTHRDASGAAGSAIPFFAMEYIADALPITQYADAKGLDRRARLTMFIEVCDAVQHGHQSGVIHRDLKPGNILVDASGISKVIDFGIAKSTDPEHAFLTRESGVGQVIGTLNYMSPEQCAASASIDVRSDVYALGMILYELLCGRLPHDLTRVPLPEALRVVQQDPPTRPTAIDASLRGDLEAIVLKAIDKDPDRRYRTAAALGSDVRRYLRHETIEARPPTLMYQCRLFARRHRALVAAMIAIASTLLLATFVSTSLAIWANAESKRRLAAENVATRERDIAVRKAYVASVSAALSSIGSGEFQAARRQLEDAPVQHRGWEWRFLFNRASTERQVVDAHHEMIYDMALSPDKKLMATCARDGGVSVWDARTLELITLCDGFATAVHKVAFSPDSTRLAAGNDGGEIRVWDARTGAQHKNWNATTDRITALVWPDADHVVVSSETGHAVRWNVNSAQRVAEIDSQPGGVSGLAISDDRTRLLTWNDTGELWVRSIDASQVFARVKFVGAIECATISPDNTMFAAAGEGARIQIWNARNAAVLHDLKIPESVSLVRTLAFAPDGLTMAAGLGDRSIVAWTVATTAQIAIKRGHGDAVTSIAFLEEESTLVSASLDGTVRAWNIAEQDRSEAVRPLEGHAGRVITTAFSADGSMLASGSLDKTVHVWDPATQQSVGVLTGHHDAVYGVAFSPDGELLASASLDNTVRIWSTWTGECRRVFAEHTDDVWAVAWSPDGRLIASGGNDRIIRIWNALTGEVVQTLPGHAERVTSLEFSPDGALLASTSRDHTARIWSLAEGRSIFALNGHRSDVFCCAFSPDGERLYTGSRDQTVRVWNTRTGALEDTLDGHGQWITDLSFNDEGTRLAGCSWFTDILIWDIPSHEIVASFKGHAEVIRAVQFDRQGRWLASASYDGVVNLYDGMAQDQLAVVSAKEQSIRDDAHALVQQTLAGSTSVQVVAEAAMSRNDLEPAQRPWIRKEMLRACLGAPTAAP